MTFKKIELGQPFVSSQRLWIKASESTAVCDDGDIGFFHDGEEAMPLPRLSKLIESFQALTLGTGFISLARDFGLDRKEARAVLAIKEQLREANL